MKNLLGGKGANLAEMTNIGIPVPPGFTISTDICAYYYDNDPTYNLELNSYLNVKHIHVLTFIFSQCFTITLSSTMSCLCQQSRV